MTTDLPSEDDLFYPGPSPTLEPSRRRRRRPSRALFFAILATLVVAGAAAVTLAPGLDREETTGFAVSPPADACWAEAPNLWHARLAYSRTCEEPRVDCDPTAEGWICASRELDLDSPTTPLSVTVTTSEQPPTTADPYPCTAEARKLRAAIVAYEETCTQPRADCDPISGGWICSSHRMGSSGQTTTTLPTSTTAGDDPTTTVGDEDGTTSTSGGSSTTTSGSSSSTTPDTEVSTSTTTKGTTTTSRSTSTTRATTSTTRATTSTTRATTTTTRPTTTTTRPTTSTTRPVVNNGPFNASRDLLVLHYDHAPDRDDGHATVAAREIVHDFGISPLVVGGTYGENRNQYDDKSEGVMDATWGSGGWLNAHTNWNGAVATEASRWESVLRAGGDVWVAEGGQSDLTADVMRRVAQSLPSVDLGSRVHVVQHSNWNQRYTTDADLDYVRNNSDYIKIADGNLANSTADLSGKNASFVSAARNGRFASAWNVAFAYLDPNHKLDFSDTVEVLHIVGVGTDQVADVGDFADYFIR